MKIRSLRPPPPARSLSLAVAGPATAVALGLAVDRDSVIAATSVALLAVVVAAAFGGHLGGLTASVVGFLALNFFFTAPYHTFVVGHPADFVALLVFLAVSTLVGALLARAIDERARAERRGAELAFLDHTTAQLVSGEPLDAVLRRCAQEIVGLFALAGCQILLHGGEPITAAGEAAPGDLCVTVPLGAAGSRGELTVWRSAGAAEFNRTERSFLQALAVQLGLALERADLDEQAAAARVEAQASALRAALFSSVTHDLRTPLSSIKASAGGLLDRGATHTDGQRDELLHTIVEEADRLNRLVGNLLDLARMRAGVLTPARELVWVPDLIGAVLHRMRASLTGLEVRVDIRGELPGCLADPTQLDQALTNVIENAARFSPPGGELRITATRWRDGVQIRVADEGPGIAVEERDRVFEEFYRKDTRTGRGGTGLGLSIARAILFAHDGRIWVEGSPRGGAAVVLELPVVRHAPPPAPAQASSS